jgi:hypothetical protein
MFIFGSRGRPFYFKHGSGLRTPAIRGISHEILRIEGVQKALGGENARHTRQYVSILKLLATPPRALRRISEIGSRRASVILMKKIAS